MLLNRLTGMLGLMASLNIMKMFSISLFSGQYCIKGYNEA